MVTSLILCPQPECVLRVGLPVCRAAHPQGMAGPGQEAGKEATKRTCAQALPTTDTENGSICGDRDTTGRGMVLFS